MSGRIAGAPISWGVCEVPGWGYQLSPERVLAEMAEEGLTATELGPEGFLPPDPTLLLASYGLEAVGGFVPVVLHEVDFDPRPGVTETLAGFPPHGVLVLAAATGGTGYDTRPDLDADGWVTLLRTLDQLAALATDRGVLAVLHPHVGTLVETSDDVQRVLEGSSMPLCLDTGHLLIGGTDPAELARDAPERIAHTHLKDVDADVADRVRAGNLTYTDGVRQGMYQPLGAGDVDLTAIVQTLEGRSYQGWYVLEQDTVLATEPAPGGGPREDVRTSAQFVRRLLEAGQQ
jgi:inosose dehydratase